MKKLLFLCVLLFVSCQNMAIERGPNSFDYEFSPSATCDEVQTTLTELNSHAEFKYDENETSKWFSPIGSRPKAIALVAHGLNLRPSKMNSLVKVLTNENVEVLRLSLGGHRGSKREGLFTTHQGWRNEFQAHYCLALKKAKKESLPIYYLGFSLGALIGLDFLNTQDFHHVKKMILISPATDVHWYSKIPGKLGWIGGKISLPSKNLKEYRSQPSTSLASYSAMKESQKSLQEVNINSLNIPTLIYVDPDDELVSLKKIKKRISKHSLDNWKLKTISNKGSTLKKTYHHLVVDKASMGPKVWEDVTSQIKNHFK
jgi:esterase/lipase